MKERKTETGTASNIAQNSLGNCDTGCINCGPVGCSSSPGLFHHRILARALMLAGKIAVRT